MLLFGLMTMMMVNVARAQSSTDVEKFIKKYEDQGNYVEMSRAFIESLRPRSQMTRAQYIEVYAAQNISSQSVLLSFKSLAAPIQYSDELLKAIEKDKFERQTYSRNGEVLSAQYTREYENKMDCIIFNKTSKEVSVILMTGQDISFTDFLGYLHLIRRYAPYKTWIVD